MRKTTFICNHCNEVIEGGVYKTFINKVDDNEKLVQEADPEERTMSYELSNIHLCINCARALANVVKEGIPEPVNEEISTPEITPVQPLKKRGRPRKECSGAVLPKKEAVAAAMKKVEKTKGE